MKYSLDRIEETYPLLKDFLYHVASYRQIDAILNKLPGDSEFWTYTCNAHLENAALLWCMVFGADSNETHWKRIFAENSQEARNSFLEYLKITNNITSDAFREYWESVTSFRNDYVAHKAKYSNPVPNFDMACTIVFCLNDWIQKQDMPGIVGFPEFKELLYEYQENIRETLQCIVDNNKKTENLQRDK